MAVNLGPSTPFERPAWQRTRRPAVLDASRRALIPLRPMTMTEVLDAAFLVVRQNIRLMIGLPLVIAGGAGAYLLLGMGLWFGLGNSTEQWVQILCVVLFGLLGLLILTMCLVWMTAILTRVTLQTVLGPGFAPATELSLREALKLFWPMVGLSLLQSVASSFLQSVIGILYYIGLIAVLVLDEPLRTWVAVLVSVLGYLLLAGAYSYLSLTVPAYATENANAPVWIGTPARRTNIVTAFMRSFSLIGLRNLPRAALIMAGGLTVSLLVITLLGLGSLLIVLLYATSLGVDPMLVLTNPLTYVGVLGFSSVVAMSALLAFIASVQTMLYLDLRMRREGLDLAMRFDCVPIPQPSAPPPPPMVYPPIAYPPLPPPAAAHRQSAPPAAGP